MNNPNSQKGISLYMAVIVLAILLGISLGLSSLIVTKIKIIRGMEESVIAFYAADTGIEVVLVERQNPNLSGYSGSVNLGGGDTATYDVTVTRAGQGSCAALNFCIKSIGNYKNTRRAVEVRY